MSSLPPRQLPSNVWRRHAGPTDRWPHLDGLQEPWIIRYQHARFDKRWHLGHRRALVLRVTIGVEHSDVIITENARQSAPLATVVLDRILHFRVVTERHAVQQRIPTVHCHAFSSETTRERAVLHHCRAVVGILEWKVQTRRSWVEGVEGNTCRHSQVVFPAA